MKERPILFSAQMVNAILDGSKTQTRRALKVQPIDVLSMKGDKAGIEWVGLMQKEPEMSGTIFRCKFGQSGDRLYVRETCRAEELEYAGWEDGVRYLADNHWRAIDNTREAAEEWIDLNSYRGQKGAVVPSIHMPRWASRILLEIVSVRVERLQDISVEDAIAEGLKGITKDGKLIKYGIPDRDGYPGIDNTGWPWEELRISPVDAYRKLWESINGPGSWDANPWVWCISFKVVKP